MADKKYILLRNEVQQSITDSTTFPPTSGAVKTALDGKVDAETGKRLMTDAEGTKLSGIETGAQVNLIEEVQVGGVALDIDEKAVNVPIASTSGLGVVKVGTGLSITEAGVLTADTQLHFEVFQTLPTAGAQYAQTIALILKAETETGNIYKEYACVNTSGTTWAWEQIGETQFELNIVQNASGITINGTALQSASASQKGLLAAADFATFNGKQDAIGEDTTISAAYVDETETRKFVSPTEKSTWNGKQNAITESSKLNADLVDDTTATHKFVTGTQITSWTNHVSSTANPHNVTKAQVGLENVDNTSDLNKPISTATQTALNAKVDEVEGTVAIGHDSTGYYFNE